MAVKQQHGVAYLWMLFLVFLLSLGLGKTLEVYSVSLQRQKEAELFYVANLYREAIKQFYLSSPGSLKQYPASLDDLLKDPRSLSTRRYLRRLYADPMTGKPFAPVMSPQGGVWGVRSTLNKKPLKRSGFDDIYFSFANSDSYQKWQFVYAGGI